MQFSKYVGAGNDFILIDNRELFFLSDDPLFISKLCHRQYGIGADGLILLENSKKADFKMRIFNADGSEAEMCGNGIRCLFKYIQECGGDRPSCTIETKESIIQLQEEKSNPDHIRASMQDPTEIRWSLKLEIDSRELTIHHLNTGVPHAVIFLDKIEDSDLKELAPKIRFHKAFLPKGTNVNFVTMQAPNEISVRTYERGVENETLACGTGATACALATAYLFNICLPIKVKTKSGEELKIDYIKNDVNFTNVTMSGPAHLVYRGEIEAVNSIIQGNYPCLNSK